MGDQPTLAGPAANPPLGSEAHKTKPVRSEARVGYRDAGSADGL
jgi:hypothetical protein